MQVAESLCSWWRQRNITWRCDILPVEPDLASVNTMDQWLLENLWIGQNLLDICKVGPDSDPMVVVVTSAGHRYTGNV